MTNPTSNSRVRLLMGFGSGVVVIGGLILLLAVATLVRGLPADPLEVERYESTAPSRLESADGRLIAEFPLVEAAEPLRADAKLLVEAYLSLRDGAFYEAREGGTPIVSVLRGAWTGERVAASPLSVAVARALRPSQRATRLGRLRTDLLAARLDRSSELHDRTTAFLQTLPLCEGRRGVVEALRTCLGAPDPLEIGPAEAAFLAAAAAFSLDLSDDVDILQARAAAVLDQLVLQRRLDPEAAPRLLGAAAERARAHRRALDRGSEDPLVGALTRSTRARFGMALEPSPVTLRTTLVAETQAAFANEVALRGGAWAVIDPRSGRATALGGDLDRPLPAEAADRFEALLGGASEPRLAHLLGGLVAAAEALDGVPRGRDTEPRRRLDAVTGIRHGETIEEASVEGPVLHVPTASAEQAWLALDGLPREGLLRVGRAGRVTAFAHPTAVGVLLGRDRDRMLGLQLPPGVLQAARGDDDFPVPDGLWIAADGAVLRRGVR